MVAVAFILGIVVILQINVADLVAVAAAIAITDGNLEP